MPRLKKPDPLAKAIGRRARELRRERGLMIEKLGFENDISKGWTLLQLLGRGRRHMLTRIAWKQIQAIDLRS